jgi:hypothetical protein
MAVGGGMAVIGGMPWSVARLPPRSTTGWFRTSTTPQSATSGRLVLGVRSWATRLDDVAVDAIRLGDAIRLLAAAGSWRRCAYVSAQRIQAWTQREDDALDNSSGWQAGKQCAWLYCSVARANREK